MVTMVLGYIHHYHPRLWEDLHQFHVFNEFFGWMVKRLFWSDFLLGFQTIYWDVSGTFEDEINVFKKTYFS